MKFDNYPVERFDSRKHIRIGAFNNCSYMSQFVQNGIFTVVNGKVGTKPYTASFERNVNLFIDNDVLITDPMQKFDVLVGYNTHGSQSQELLMEALNEDIPVHLVRRLPKTLQQLLLNKLIKKHAYNTALDGSIKTHAVLTSNMSFARTTPHLAKSNDSSHWWTVKTEFGSMSDNVFIFDGGRANIRMFLHKFNGPSTPAKLKEMQDTFRRLVESKAIKLPNGKTVNDYNIANFFNGQIMAQEYQYFKKEYRVIKYDNCFDVYAREHLLNDRYPYNNGLNFHYPLYTIRFDDLGGVDYSNGGVKLKEDDDIILNSKVFAKLLGIFLDPKMDFPFGSIDIWSSDTSDTLEVGVFEYQPQYGVMDIYPDMIDRYTKSFINYLINKFDLLGESNDSGSD